MLIKLIALVLFILVLLVESILITLLTDWYARLRSRDSIPLLLQVIGEQPEGWKRNILCRVLIGQFENFRSDWTSSEGDKRSLALATYGSTLILESSGGRRPVITMRRSRGPVPSIPQRYLLRAWRLLSKERGNRRSAHYGLTAFLFLDKAFHL